MQTLIWVTGARCSSVFCLIFSRRGIASFNYTNKILKILFIPYLFFLSCSSYTYFFILFFPYLFFICVICVICERHFIRVICERHFIRVICERHFFCEICVKSLTDFPSLKICTHIPYYRRKDVRHRRN